MDQNIRINWKVNNMIRHKGTGHPYLVLHVSRYYCTIIDLELNDPLVQPLVLLPRNYSDYAKDHEMEAIVKKNMILKWEYRPVYL